MAPFTKYSSANGALQYESNGVMRSDRLAEKTRRAAALNTDCSRSCSLNVPHPGQISAWLSVGPSQ